MMAQENITAECDVAIVGGGPVGLLLAYQLKRFGVSAAVFEKHVKETQDAYGRAVALFPRTMEQLDQLDIAEAMLQLGFACRNSVTYKNGERIIPGRVWTFMENIQNTTYNFVLVLRQMYTEAIFRERLDAIGASHYQATECIDFAIDESVQAGNYPITSTFVDSKTRQNFEVKRQGSNLPILSKYLIGADGGHSFVRRVSGIPLDGDTSEDKWIRIDGIVETDMPITRAYGAIESKTHGNVLWVPLDHGATRIGYSYSADIAAKYPDGVTEEVAVQEAIECMKPFNLRFKEVHWWTLYTIGQRIAREFSTKDRVFLCGDAAHTHSSGAAQGLNTGIHDAVNLGWKLALHIRGATKSEVLRTYSSERLTAVNRLINYDKDISVLMSHKWPSWYTGDPDADPYIVLGEIFDQAASFNTGLGISYPSNVLNHASTMDLNALAGARPPDVDLMMPGTNTAIRFQRVTRNLAKFWVVVYTGNPESTKTSLLNLEKFLETSKELNTNQAIGWITINPTVGFSPYEALGMKPFGNLYFDPTNVAHEKIGISSETGGVMVLRPDGLVGSAGHIDGPWIEAYFKSIMDL